MVLGREQGNEHRVTFQITPVIQSRFQTQGKGGETEMLLNQSEASRVCLTLAVVRRSFCIFTCAHLPTSHT